jgi:MFS family permease
MLISQFGTATISLAVAVLVDSGAIQIWHLFVSGVIQGVIFSFSGPARQAIIPEVVGEKEMMNAIALNSAGMNLTRIIGPTLALSLLGVPGLDLEAIYYFQALLNVVAVAFIMMMRYEPVAMERARVSVLKDMVDGLRYVLSSPILLTLLAMALVPALLGMSYQSFLAVFAKDVFGDGSRNESGLTWMATVSAVGAVVGSLAIATMTEYPRRTQLQLIAGIVFGLALAFFAVQGNLGLALAGLAILGLASTAFQALNNTMVMTASNPQYHGRVMAVYMMTFSLMPLGTLPMGLVADAIPDLSLGSFDLIGIQTATMGAGLILAAFIFMVTVVNPSYRRLVQEDFQRFAAVTTKRISEDTSGLGALRQIRQAMSYERGSSMAGRLAAEGAERLVLTDDGYALVKDDESTTKAQTGG